jgi:PAS domain-containing protein
MVTISDTHPPEENLTQMIALISILTVLVFYSDITTPLGLMTWILYFIPLFLTLYIKWQYGPFIVAGTAIIFIGISYLLSPRDMSEFFALINRVFFCLMLVVSAILIWRHKKWELSLETSEERYQNMIESSPEAILITKDGIIQYINPSGMQLCTAGGGLKTGDTCLDLFDPADQELISSTIEKAVEGAKVELLKIRMRSGNNITHLADVWIGEIIWDGVPAIQMIIRTRTLNQD